MATRRLSNLSLIRPGNWQTQTAWNTPLDATLMTEAIKATAFIDVDETVDEVFDCTGEDLLVETVLGRLARLTLDIPDVDAEELAGWTALAYGVAAAPTGGTNEVQTITGAATGGTAMLAFEDLYIRRQTPPLAFDITAAALQTALRALTNIGAGGVVTAGGPLGTAPITVTFQGALSDRDLALLELVSSLTGGTWNIVQTTPGAGASHAISRLGNGLYVLPYTTFYLGFRGSSRQPLILKNAVVDSFRLRASAREKATLSVTICASADVQDAVGFVIPECVDIEPIRFGDCDLLINGASLYDEASVYGVENGGVAVAREWEYGYQNNVLTGNYAFTGRGIDVTRLHRADRRPSMLNVGALGEKGDTLYNLADGRHTVSAQLIVGPSAKNVTYNIPQGLAKFDAQRIRFEDEASESTLRPVIRPKRAKGDAATPSNVVATVPQAVAFLTPA